MVVAVRGQAYASVGRIPQVAACQISKGRSFSGSAAVASKGMAESTIGQFDQAKAERLEMAMHRKTHEELMQDSEKQFMTVAKGGDSKYLDPKDVREFVVAEIKRNKNYARSDATVEYVLSKVDECLAKADMNNDGKIELHEFFDLWRRISMVQLEGIRSDTGVDLRAALEAMIAQKPK